MNFLLDNPLALMYGPYFLILYGFFILFTLLFLGLIKTSFDKTGRLAIPAIPPTLDPYEIAYLRGGTNELARSIVFSLMRKGWIEISSGDSIAIKPIESVEGRPRLNEIEKLTHSWIGKGREAKDTFNNENGLVQQLRQYGSMYQAQLESRQILTSLEMHNRIRRWKILALAAIILLGFYKLSVAVIAGNFNFVLLIIFAMIGVGVAVKIGSLPRLTELGKTYLERLQIAFENLRYQSEPVPLHSVAASQTAFAGVDPLLLSVGVFGGWVLADSAYDSYNQAFKRAEQQSNTSGSSCGSGCGSSCSSGGGGSSCSSGDGGGSSCGGGCGGCS